jgi:ribosome-associated protein
VPTEKKSTKPRASQKTQSPSAPRGATAKTKRTAAATAAKPVAPTKSVAPAKPLVGRTAGKVPVSKPAAPKYPLRSVLLDALDDMKALDVRTLDVRGLTDIADYMVIASGTSDRHVRSVAQRVVEKAKEAGFRPHGVEGLQDGDWVLIDLHEYIVHVMLPRVREFYGLEKLWDITAAKRAVRA